MTFSPTVIDLSRVPAPSAIEALDFETLFDAWLEAFQTYWAQARAIDPTLPAYDVDVLETDPVVVVGQAASYLRLLDRARVNDGIRALLAPLSWGTNLDNLAAARNLTRLEVIAADGSTPAVMETDAQFLRRLLLSYDRPASGSAGRYLFDAWTAWPAMQDARVNGFDVHGRRGDTDVVIIGPNGDLPTEGERDAVTAAVRHVNRMPEGIGLSILSATRHEYAVDLTIEVPGIGPDAELVRLEALKRVRAAADLRTVIGGEIPAGFIAGAAYGDNVITVADNAPIAIASDPYTVPVLTDITVGVEVRQ